MVKNNKWKGFEELIQEDLRNELAKKLKDLDNQYWLWLKTSGIDLSKEHIRINLEVNIEDVSDN